jgi:glucose/arabinose dehydrogenase
VAPLSIRFLRRQADPAMNGAALVAQHGSWNRSEKTGYSVVSLHWGDDSAISRQDFVTGFEAGGDVVGRPVDVVEAGDGTIFVSDDFAGAIYRISYRS